MKIQRLQFKLNTVEIKELKQNLSVKHFMHSLRPDDSVTWRGGETSVLAETAFHVCDGAAIGATRRCPFYISHGFNKRDTASARFRAQSHFLC